MWNSIINFIFVDIGFLKRIFHFTELLKGTLRGNRSSGSSFKIIRIVKWQIADKKSLFKYLFSLTSIFLSEPIENLKWYEKYPQDIKKMCK